MASDRTRELARDVIDQVLMSYGAGFGTDKMLEIVLPKLDAFEREVKLAEAKEIQRELEWANELKTITRVGRVTTWLAERIAELAAQPTPEVKK